MEEGPFLTAGEKNMIMGFKKVKVALFLEHFFPEAFPFVSLKSLFDIKTKRFTKI